MFLLADAPASPYTVLLYCESLKKKDHHPCQLDCWRALQKVSISQGPLKFFIVNLQA
jgi:hypothetical protein